MIGVPPIAPVVVSKLRTGGSAGRMLQRVGGPPEFVGRKAGSEVFIVTNRLADGY